MSTTNKRGAIRVGLYSTRAGNRSRKVVACRSTVVRTPNNSTAAWARLPAHTTLRIDSTNRPVNLMDSPPLLETFPLRTSFAGTILWFVFIPCSAPRSWLLFRYSQDHFPSPRPAKGIHGPFFHHKTFLDHSQDDAITEIGR